MTRSNDHSASKAKRKSRRHRFGAFTGIIAIAMGLLVTVAGPARAILTCANGDLSCPIANDDEYATNFNVKLTVDAAHGLLANDVGIAGQNTRIDPTETDTESWDGAQVRVKSDGSFTYTPDPDPANAFSGQDTFDYGIVDNQDGFDFATAYIDVIPIVRNDSYSTRMNVPLVVPAATGVVANDGGIDPDSLILSTTSTHGGTITDDTEGAFTYTPPPGFQGTDTFTYQGFDLDFDLETPYTGTVTIFIDGAPPVVSMSAPTSVSMSPQVVARWSATDGLFGSGVASYNVQDEIAAWNAPFKPWAWFKQATVTTAGTLAGTYGRTFCFRVDAVDRAHNTSPWLTRCTSVPLRSVSLTYSKYWTKLTNVAYFAGNAYSTNRNAQNATLPAVQAQHMWLLATKCASCGTVQVRWNNVPIANVNLASPITVHHALIPIAAFPTPKLGGLRFQNTSPNGKLVILEGVAILRG